MSEDVKAETAEGEKSDPEEQPEIDPDEQAEVDLEDIDPDAIEDETNPSDTGDSTEPDEGDDSDATADDSGTPASGAKGESQTWGDMYVSGLATVTKAAKDELGEGGDVDEELARQIELDRHFDEWLDSQGMGEDMPPGQAVMVGSAMFLMVELGTDSEIVNKAINGGF